MEAAKEIGQDFVGIESTHLRHYELITDNLIINIYNGLVSLENAIHRDFRFKEHKNNLRTS